MDQQVDKKIELKDKIVNFFKKNKKKIIFLLIFTVLLIILISAYSIYKEKKNIKISQQFITAGILLSSQDYENSKKIYENIILSKNKFYSNLALNVMIEQKLEKNKEKLLNYFKIVESLDYSQDQKDLILFKKALFLINTQMINEGEDILKNLIKSNSKIKSLAEEITKN